MQQRSFQWKDDDYTDSLNRHLLGVIPYGLYCGFDPVLAAGLTLQLRHTDTGLDEVTDQAVRTAKLGKLVTQQGVRINEDAAISLGIAANGSAYPRIDTIVVEHQYVPVTGGTPAIYKVIQGAPSVTPVPPTVPYPLTQMAIGYLYMPGNAASLATAGVSYTRAVVPTLGNDDSFVKKAGVQTVTGRKQMLSMYGQFKAIALQAQGAGTLLNLFSAEESNYYVLPKTDDTYKTVDTLKLPFNGDGYPVDILCLQRLKISSPVVASTAATGNIFLGEADAQGTLYIEAGEIIRLIDMNAVYWKGKNNAPPVVSTQMYIVSKGGHASKGAMNKYVAEQVQNKGTGTVAGGEVALDSLGNYYALSMTNGSVLNCIPKRSLNYTGKEAAGAIIAINIILAGSNTAVLTNLYGGSVPSYCKTLTTGTGSNITLNNGDLLLLIEDETTWRVLGIIGANKNIVTLAASLATFISTVNSEITDINAAITTLSNEIDDGLADVNTRIDNLSLSILNDAKVLMIAASLDPNIILKGLAITNVVGDFSSGTLDIASGIVQVGDDILNVPAYSGQYPIYLEKVPAGTTTRYVTAPVDANKAIKFDPYTSQRLKDVVKRAAWDIGDVRMSVVLSSDFDATGLGRWTQKGFALMNYNNSTVGMEGIVPLGLKTSSYDPGDSYDSIEYEYRTMLNTMGEKFHSLTSNENGPHTHTFNPGDQNGRSDNANDRDVMLPGGQTRTTASSGLGTGHETRQPSRVLAFIQRI